jgi:tRNA pseudouridine55 synthase
MPMMSERAQSMSGLLVVDKPLGWTSTEVVRQVRRAAGGVKAGHAGTLDPLATGVVIVCLGQATRAVDRLMSLPKTYEAVVDLSATTASDDLESPRQEVAVSREPDLESVRAAAARFVGLIQQMPPAFSAMKIGGKRAYKLARKGRQVPLRPREVTVYAIDVLDYAWPRVTLRIECGRGTYIRSLARDLGVALATGGHLASLRRTAVGPYKVEQAADGSGLARDLTQADLLPVPPVDPPITTATSVAGS